ncbi:hypothetical protein BDV36DRAFT_26451 [Aspergillus pseudocaelatus]|uniref:Uncharacterized protein n=1 Tax=Aspergillus pseudocaelatus TaxID=1825620 RepID=A0ABQ6W994_9EURO|nr:hypothetical protein BDV36DRAFT_26451 [Aspergillus pseudocaelatus]
MIYHLSRERRRTRYLHGPFHNCTICLTLFFLTLGHQSPLILPLTNPLPTRLVSYYLLVVLPRSGIRTRKNKTHTDSANGGPSLRPAGQCVCPWIRLLARARQPITSVDRTIHSPSQTNSLELHLLVNLRYGISPLPSISCTVSGPQLTIKSLPLYDIDNALEPSSFRSS